MLCQGTNLARQKQSMTTFKRLVCNFNDINRIQQNVLNKFLIVTSIAILATPYPPPSIPPSPSLPSPSLPPPPLHSLPPSLPSPPSLPPLPTYLPPTPPPSLPPLPLPLPLLPSPPSPPLPSPPSLPPVNPRMGCLLET